MGRQRIVVGYNGSSAAQQGLLWAADEAVRRRGQWIIAYADEGDHASGAVNRQRSHELMTQAVAMVIDTVYQTGVSTVVREEPARELLVELSHEADLLVIGSHGKSWLTGTLLASVTYHVAAHADCPVVIVGPRQLCRDDEKRAIAVGVSARPTGLAALEFAFTEAGIREVPVHAVRSWSEGHWRAPLLASDGEGCTMMREQQGRLLTSVIADVSRRHPHVEVVSELSSQTLYDALHEAAEKADLLILGCRCSADDTFPRVGPITSWVMQRWPGPVVVVGQHTTADSELGARAGR
jgi:nucleotide-binding universal stress UspA family protein